MTTSRPAPGYIRQADDPAAVTPRALVNPLILGDQGTWSPLAEGTEEPQWTPLSDVLTIPLAVRSTVYFHVSVVFFHNSVESDDGTVPHHYEVHMMFPQPPGSPHPDEGPYVVTPFAAADIVAPPHNPFTGSQINLSFNAVATRDGGTYPLGLVFSSDGTFDSVDWFVSIIAGPTTENDDLVYQTPGG